MQIRYRALILWVGLSVAMLWPAVRNTQRRGDPIVAYVSFPVGSPKSNIVLTHARAISSDKTTRPLPPELSTGAFGTKNSMATILRRAYAGQDERAVFCREIAKRVAETVDPTWADATGVEIARSHFNVATYFESSQQPTQKRPVQRCEIER